MATRTISNAGGNFNATGTWVEGAVPTLVDDVVATATSGPLTVNVVSTCRSMDLSLYTSTLTSTAQLAFGTSTANAGLFALKLGPSMTLTGTGVWAFGGTYVTNALTIDLAGKTLGGGANFTSACRYQLASAFACGAISHTGGVLDTNSFAVSCSSFSSSGSTARTLTFGSSAVTLTGSGAVVQFLGTNLTVNAGTSSFTVAAANNCAMNFTAPGLTLGSLVFTNSGVAAIAGTFTVANITRTGTAAVNERLWFSAGATVTVTGTLTVTGQAAYQRVWMAPGASAAAAPTDGSTVTIALGASGTAALTNVDIMDVTFTGTAVPVSGTRVGNCLGNSGVTFDTSRTLYWVGTGAGNWSDTTRWSLTSGGTGGELCPLPQDDARFDVNSGIGTVTCDAGDRLCRNYEIVAGSSAALNISGIGLWSIFGNHTNAVTNSVAAWGATYRGRGSHTITGVNGTTRISGSATVIAPGGTYTLTADTFLNGALTVTAGTLALGSFRLGVNAQVVANSGTLTRAINFGSGTLAVGDNWLSGTAGSNFTVIPGTGTLSMEPASGSKALTSAGQPMPSLRIGPTLTTAGAQLSDAYTTTGTVTVTRGVLNTASFALTCAGFISTGTVTRSITLGGSVVTVNGDTTFTGSGLTFTAGSSTWTVNGVGTETKLTTIAGAIDFWILILRPAANANNRITVDRGFNTARDLTIDATSTPHGNVVFQGDINVNGGTFKCDGVSGTPVTIYGPDWGGQVTCYAPTTALTYTTFNRVLGAGGGAFSGTGVTFAHDGWKQTAEMTVA